MIPYIEEMMKDFSKYEKNMKISATPASYHLLMTQDNAIVIEET